MYRSLTTGKFRENVWDPSQIIAQIISVQCLLYISLVFFLAALNLLLGRSQLLDQIFLFQIVSLGSEIGRTVIVAYLLNSLVGALVLWYAIKSARKCLDFTITWHLVHFAIACCYNASLPWNFSWWLLHAASATVMCVCGEMLCLRTELIDIPISYRGDSLSDINRV